MRRFYNWGFRRRGQPVVMRGTPGDHDAVQTVPSSLPLPTLGGTWGVGLKPGARGLRGQLVAAPRTSRGCAPSEVPTAVAWRKESFRARRYRAVKSEARVRLMMGQLGRCSGGLFPSEAPALSSLSKRDHAAEQYEPARRSVVGEVTSESCDGQESGLRGHRLAA